MKKSSIVQRVRAIKDRVQDVKDRVIQYLESIRETQDVHHKQLSEQLDQRIDAVREQLSDVSKSSTSLADKQANDMRGQLSQLNKAVVAAVEQRADDAKAQLNEAQQSLSSTVDSTSDRMDLHFSLVSHLLASHHAAMMTLLGAGSDEEKYKILPTNQVEFDILPVLPQRPVVNVLDIGTMPFGLRSESYSPLQAAGICRLIGIEPDEESYQKLKQMYPRDTFIQKCAGTGETRLFHYTGDRKLSSLYEPDKRVAGCFENLGEPMLLEHKEDIDTIKLDDVAEISDVDLIMNDTQGAELDIFQGAHKCLGSAVVVECEVEFVKLYKDQPLFADVDTFLRSKGYEFHKFTNQTGRLRHDFPTELVYQTRSNQVLWANAVYVRSMFELDKLPKLKLLKLAVIMHMVYKSYDLALAALNAYDRSFNTRVGPAYKRALMKAAVLR